MTLATDLAVAVARAGVDPAAEHCALQDAQKRAIADRSGYLHRELTDRGYLIELLHPVCDQFRAQRLEAAPTWCLVFMMTDGLGKTR